MCGAYLIMMGSNKSDGADAFCANYFLQKAFQEGFEIPCQTCGQKNCNQVNCRKFATEKDVGPESMDVQVASEEVHQKLFFETIICCLCLLVIVSVTIVYLVD